MEDDKINVYICEKCDSPGKCLAATYGTDSVIGQCFYDGCSANWQKTPDYQIKRWYSQEEVDDILKEVEEDEGKAHDHKTCETCKPESSKYSKDVLMSDYPELSKVVYGADCITPNCAICKWKGYGNEWKDLLNRPRKADAICCAQGSRKLTSVYGNKICKRLFESQQGKSLIRIKQEESTI